MLDQLSIIVPTLNEEHYLPKLLNSIMKQQFVGQLEVIVVDGHSEDRTLIEAKKYLNQIPQLKIIESERGVSRQRNLGASHAQYQYLLFLDADIILPDQFLNNFSKEKIEKDTLSLVVHFPPKRNFADYLTVCFVFAFVFVMQFTEPIAAGSFTLISKKMHNKIHGFKTDTVIGEDLDYGHRAIKAGAKYQLFLNHYIYASPRRFRAEGRIRLLFQWTKAWLFVRQHGPIYDKKMMTYEFGIWKEGE